MHCFPFCQEALWFFSSFFFCSIMLIFTSISHLWNANGKKKMGQHTQKEFQKQLQDIHWRVMNLYAGQIRPIVGWTLSTFWCAMCCGPSKWIHTLVLHFSGSHLKKSWWKKMRMSVASLGSWRICKNPLMPNALLEMRKKKVEHPLTLYM